MCYCRYMYLHNSLQTTLYLCRTVGCMKLCEAHCLISNRPVKDLMVQSQHSYWTGFKVTQCCFSFFPDLNSSLFFRDFQGSLLKDKCSITMVGCLAALPGAQETLYYHFLSGCGTLVRVYWLPVYLLKAKCCWRRWKRQITEGRTRTGAGHATSILHGANLVSRAVSIARLLCRWITN